MSERVRVAVIGTGYGETHIRAFAAIPDVEIVAVVSARRERAEALGEPYDVPLCTNDYMEALELKELDAVCIATPPDLHSEITLAAFARGCHVLCEKPLATTAEECETMLAVAESRGLVHATNYDWRVVPNFVKLHTLVRDGWIGDVQSVRLAWMAPWQADPAAPFGWRNSRARAGFGVLGDQSHVLDDLLSSFGPLARVCADLRTVVHDRDDGTGERRSCDAEDAVAFVAVGAGGVQITGHVSRCVAGDGYRIAEYDGSSGTLTLHMPDPSDRDRSTLTGRRDGQIIDLSESFSTPAESTQRRFMRAIRDRSVPVFTSFAEGLEVVRLAEAMRTSSESGRWIDLSSASPRALTERSGKL